MSTSSWFGMDCAQGLRDVHAYDPGGGGVGEEAQALPVNGRMRSLQDVAVALEAAGHVTRAGTRYAPAAIARMVGA